MRVRKGDLAYGFALYHWVQKVTLCMILTMSLSFDMSFSPGLQSASFSLSGPSTSFFWYVQSFSKKERKKLLLSRLHAKCLRGPKPAHTSSYTCSTYIRLVHTHTHIYIHSHHYDVQCFVSTRQEGCSPEQSQNWPATVPTRWSGGTAGNGTGR